MSKQQIKQIIESRTSDDGLTETGANGVKLFRAITAVPCAPAVYEPCVIAIVSGSKEAVLDGQRYIYDSSQYLCCPMSIPVQAGTPAASPEHPLYGVYVSLDQRVMTELVMEMDNAGGGTMMAGGNPPVQGISFSHWDEAFTDALLRLLQLGQSQTGHGGA